ncbi:FAD binding domain-containing protein [Trametes elegans]|nr:FAD binding domain-containing protein [Trametes elegans]
MMSLRKLFERSPAPPAESEVDVLVIGAGPAGLMCATALVRAGVRVRIVDKRAEHVLTGHADGIQARTLEILQSYGVLERYLSQAALIHRAAFYNPTPNGGIERTKRGPSYTAPSARYCFSTALNQCDIENLFLDLMRSHNLDVERQTTPTSLELSEDEARLSDINKHPVKVVLEHMDRDHHSSETVHAKFVVGADGAHSWVRRRFGINMNGDSTDHIWGVVDMVPDTDFPDVRTLTFVQSHHGSAIIVPRERDMIRIYVALTDEDLVDPQTKRVDKDRSSPEKILAVAQKVLQPYRMEAAGDIDWWTVYVIGQRVAERCSVHDRVFIAGDACHTHSPKGGQGMNASMIDTHNLAWKLAYVIRGWADQALLKTYQEERLKYAEDLIAFDREWSGVFTKEDASEEEIHRTFRESDGFITGTGLQYAPSTIVEDAHQASAPNVLVGRHMPSHVFVRAADAVPVNIQDLLPADMRFKVLFFVGDIAENATAERVRDLATRLAVPESFLQRYGRDDKAFDRVCISASNKDAVEHNDFPQVLRSHWSKILLDDVDVQGKSGGGGFAAYGIDPQAGAIVVVRPDGHIGLVAPGDRPDVADSYFSSFMITL